MDKKKNIFIITVILVLASLGVFIGLSRTKKSRNLILATEKTGQAKIKFWTCAMHPEVRADKPGKCPICGMDLIPVEQEEEEKPAVEITEPQREKKIVYYRHPMNPEVTSSSPMKDEMGMDYIPVYEEEVSQGKGPVVKLTTREIELAGVETEVIKTMPLVKEIRTAGRIAYDPELAITQEEFVSALETRDKTLESLLPQTRERLEELIKKTKFHLHHLGMSEAQIEEMEKTRKTDTNLILPEVEAWVYAEVYEYELSWIKEGTPIKATAVAYPADVFRGEIKAITPLLNPQTRSVQVRAKIDNPGLKLKPEMFVDVLIEAGLGEETLAVPREAILDTGTRKVVWVSQGEGKFLGKEIQVGPEAVGLIGEVKRKFYPVLSGLSEGDIVVTKGNFLIDSQSQLTGGMSVLWGGAEEIKEKPLPVESGEAKTEHRH